MLFNNNNVYSDLSAYCNMAAVLTHRLICLCPFYSFYFYDNSYTVGVCSVDISFTWFTDYHPKWSNEVLRNGLLRTATINAVGFQKLGGWQGSQWGEFGLNPNPLSIRSPIIPTHAFNQEVRVVRSNPTHPGTHDWKECEFFLFYMFKNYRNWYNNSFVCCNSPLYDGPEETLKIYNILPIPISFSRVISRENELCNLFSRVISHFHKLANSFSRDITRFHELAT